MMDGTVRRARRLAAAGDDEAAKLAYLDALRQAPADGDILTELGVLAYAGGYVSAAREAYRQAIRCNPNHTLARVGFADLLSEASDEAAACQHYRAALAIDPDMYQAHRGLARALSALGEDAGEHWQKGFRGHAIVNARYRGHGLGIPVLLLAAAVGGNVPTSHWIDDRTFAVTGIYTDFVDPATELPPHAMIVNAIGDADLCQDALANAARIVARCSTPIVNHPSRVATTSREEVARRLADIPGLIAPRIARLSSAEPRFPLLLRSPGYHTGRNFLRVEAPETLTETAMSLPCRDPLTIEYLDARGPDGMFRKYRVMFIDGVPYPLHLAISADWKVHYFTAAMAAEPAFRDEERRFLDDMPAVLGPRAMAALHQARDRLSLDFSGIDFALAPDGSILLFEANATMVINPPPPDAMWDYRRPAANAALTAARQMVARRAGIGP